MPEELRDSGIVTAIATVGFVFGLIGMLGSFIPILGAASFHYIGVPAAIISAISLVIANIQKAKKNFAIVALTVSLIGVFVSYWQYQKLMTVGERAKKELEMMINKDTPPKEEQEKESTYKFKIIDPSKKNTEKSND